MKFSDFISNGWVIKIFSLFDIDAGLLVSLVYGLEIHLQVFLSDIDVGLTVSLLYILLSHSQFFLFWYWRWFNSLSSLHSADSFAIFCLWYWDWVVSLFFLDSEDSFAHFFFLFRGCWTSLFSLDSSLSFTLLLFSHSHLTINCFSFSSGVSVRLQPPSSYRLCLVSFITERQTLNFWTVMNIMQIRFIISDRHL